MDQNDVVEILRSNPEGALGTLGEDGPFVTGTGFLYRESDQEGLLGDIYLLLSDLARHTKNLKKNPAASLFVVEGDSEGPIHEKKRVSLQGRVEVVEDRDLYLSLKDDYLKIFPRAAIFFTLADFRFYRYKIEEIHWIGGFGKAETVRHES